MLRNTASKVAWVGRTASMVFGLALVMALVFGAVSVLVTGAIVLAVSWYATPQVQAAFAYVGVWFLLIGGVRPVFELQKLRGRGRMPESDADQLAGITHVPALFWVGIFLAVDVAALVIGGFMLAGQWLPAVSTTP